MDYRRVYEGFIRTRRLIEGDLETGYETHHIIPKCLGGDDHPENLIKLTYSDHLFAHALLARIHGGGLLVAVSAMSGLERYAGRSSRLIYQLLRGRFAEQMRGNKRGLGNKSWTGKKRPPEHFDNLRRSMIGNKRGVGNKNTLGRKMTPEQREANRLRMIGNKYAQRHKP